MVWSRRAHAPVAAADQGGNSAAAHSCQQGGYASLFAQDGSTFANAGECTSYAAKGGELAGLSLTADRASNGRFSFTFSGFGLEPGTLAYVCTDYAGFGAYCYWAPAGSGGTVAYGGSLPCTAGQHPAQYNYLVATTAAGATLYEQLPLAPGC